MLLGKETKWNEDDEERRKELQATEQCKSMGKIIRVCVYIRGQDKQNEGRRGELMATTSPSTRDEKETANGRKLPDESRTRNKPLVRLQSLYVVEGKEKKNRRERFWLTGMLRMQTLQCQWSPELRVLSHSSQLPLLQCKMAKSEEWVHSDLLTLEWPLRKPLFGRSHNCRRRRQATNSHKLQSIQCGGKEVLGDKVRRPTAPGQTIEV